MDTEPNSRTASFQGDADVPPLGTAPWHEYCVRSQPFSRDTQVSLAADSRQIQICDPASQAAVSAANASGTLTSGGGGAAGAHYADGVRCGVVLHTPPGLVVQLTFSAFVTEAGHDFLSLHDGLDATAPLLGRFSGPGTVRAAPPHLLLTETVRRGVGRGWAGLTM
jgi:hypothetical protein